MKDFGQSKQKDFAIPQPSELLEHATWKSRVWYSTICPTESQTPRVMSVWKGAIHAYAAPTHTQTKHTPLNPNHSALP